VPAVFGGSLLFHTPPEPLASWAQSYAIEMTVPTFICAGVAIFGSRIVYRLTRDLAAARRMGSYRLTDRIGVGGMGEVWRAEHRMLARPAAIKLIRPESLGEPATAATAIGRFEREAQVIANLTSPHTVVLYDFGVTDDGNFYYVMELLDGLDLRTLVEQHGPLPADRVRRILIQACHSLHDAHSSGLIHRDVKPGNVFICRRGVDFDFVKVLDFGLVKETGTATENVQLTQEGITTGTPAFMAPEMALGKSIDARTDLYALGCVGFWLLTGRLLFESDTPLGMVSQHVSEPPPRPSACTELEIPSELELLILQCLEKNPEERPRNAAELASNLAAISPQEYWTDEQARRWWASHRPRPAGSTTSVEVPTAPGSIGPGTGEH
jgi:serine/threonine-protein kinase